MHYFPIVEKTIESKMHYFYCQKAKAQPGGAKENLVNIFIGLKVDFQKLHSTYDCLFFYVKSCTAFLMDYYLIDLNFTT